jgi:chaperonin cofactor prefoldin
MPINLKPLKATMPSATSTVLDQINAEKTKVSERLARLDTERTTVATRLTDLETAERVLTRISKTPSPFEQEGTQLVNRSRAGSHQPVSYPVQRLQIELGVAFQRHGAHRRSRLPPPRSQSASRSSFL